MCVCLCMCVYSAFGLFVLCCVSVNERFIFGFCFCQQKTRNKEIFTISWNSTACYRSTSTSTSSFRNGSIINHHKCLYVFLYVFFLCLLMFRFVGFWWYYLLEYWLLYNSRRFFSGFCFIFIFLCYFPDKKRSWLFFPFQTPMCMRVCVMSQVNFHFFFLKLKWINDNQVITTTNTTTTTTSIDPFHSLLNHSRVYICVSVSVCHYVSSILVYVLWNVNSSCFSLSFSSVCLGNDS